MVADPKERAEHEDKPRDTNLELVRDNINNIYTETACFPGMSMSVEKKGQAKVNHMIDKRLNIYDIDQVAMRYSSNKCEIFSVRLLSKQAESVSILGRETLGARGCILWRL